MHRLQLPLGLAVVALVAGIAFAAQRGGHDPRVSFARDVQPILTTKCATCHPGSFPYLDLRPGKAYDAMVRVPAETNPAFEIVLPGRPELSYLLTHHPDPSNARLLTAAERSRIAEWIADGAPR